MTTVLLQAQHVVT